MKLLDTLKKFPDIEKYLSDKTIAGESAGANVWAKFFYSPKTDKISEGLGVIPIKIIPHFREEYRGKLDSVGVGLEEIQLPEYTFKVLK